jgi:hypothetical protein
VEGERPQSIQHIPGAWLYAQGKPVVHLIGSGRGLYPEGFGPTLEAIDHVGFTATIMLPSAPASNAWAFRTA